jgi:hypothetical protein
MVVAQGGIVGWVARLPDMLQALLQTPQMTAGADPAGATS